MTPITRKISWALLTAASAALLLGSWREQIGISLTECWAFVTGAVCVLLCVEENVWNFPIGIANSILFFFLFYDAKLYADMGLQIVYVVLGFQGWYQWLYTGKNRSRLEISSTTPRMAAGVAVFIVAATAGMTVFLQKQNDSSPFLDALTTVLSLSAQFLMNGKRLENWYVWITADVIYVYLYSSRELYLTAVLYAIFIIMCVAGLKEWRRTMEAQAQTTASPPNDNAVAAVAAEGELR